jgi:hypothetical protein
LPLILKSPAPDLVGSFTLNPSSPGAGETILVTAVVTNQGSVAADAFWVDFYVNPTQTPTVNKLWNDICQDPYCIGIAWFVEAGLQPGQSVTLTSNSFPGDSDEKYSIWNDSLPAGTTELYLLVDSWNRTVATGAVLESNENNNLSSMTGLNITGLATSDQPDATNVTPRPAPADFESDMPVKPLLQASTQSSKSDSADAITDFRSLYLSNRETPAQVDGFRGTITGSGTVLRWNPSTQNIRGYRVYRSEIPGLSFRLLADVPFDVASFTDSAMCGYAYFVTAYHENGESLPSTASYYSPACR